MDTRLIGELGERIAESFLLLRGYELVRRNCRVAGREIDLLMHRAGTLVAVEVKLRRSRSFGRAIEAIDRRKVDRICTALECAIRERRRSFRARVDAIVIDLNADTLTLHHLRGLGR